MVASLELGILVGLNVLDYVLFQVRKNTLDERSLKRIGEWLLLGIGMFIVPILGAALSASPNLPGWLQMLVAYTWTIATFFVLAFPILVEIILLFVARSRTARS